MSKVRHALKFSIPGTFLAKIINLLTVIIIARIMTPEELGIYAIAAAMIMVVDVFKSFGVSSYIIKKEILNKDDLHSALGLNIIITSSIGIGILMMAIPLENFYDYEDIATLLWLLSISFFVSPFFSNGMALLAREFKFKQTLQISLTSQIFEFVIVITLILLGFSYFSMAIAVAMKSIFQLLLIWLHRPDNMTWMPKFTGIKKIATFGVLVTFANLLDRLSIISMDLIIGKLGTPGMVAYFSRGLGFIEFLTATLSEGISPVTTPFLAEKRRLGHNLETAYYQAIQLLGVILIPVLLVAGVASYPVIMLFFGDQWLKCAELVSVLCFWGVFRNIHALCPSLLITSGNEKYLFFRNLLIFFLTATSVYFAFPYGLMAIAIAITGVSLVNLIVTTILLKLVLGFSIRTFFRIQIPNAFISFACFVAAYTSSKLIDFEQESIFMSFVVLIPLVSLTWLATLWLTKHPLLIEVKKLRGIRHV
jgi:O-antigen/teichoic acid export membrane protein